MWRREKVSKRRLNELFKRAQLLRPLPMVKGARIKIKFITQKATETPTFLVFLNKQVELHSSDERWIENVIRSQWAFTATPLRVVTRLIWSSAPASRHLPSMTRIGP